MTEIFAERCFTQAPISERAFDLQARACLDVHRVECQQSMLALSGERMLCHFRAPDLESARTVLRQYDADFDSVWGATIYESKLEPPAIANNSTSRVGHVLEEARFDAPVELADIQVEEDADTVRRARREVGISLDQVWAYRCIPGCPLIIGRNLILSAMSEQS